MRILWLTAAPTNYNKIKNGPSSGRGWIKSLQTLLESHEIIDELGIVFSHPTDSKKITVNKVKYYPIKKTIPRNAASRILFNWRKMLYHPNDIKALNLIIHDFKPDLIHIFGTENWFCNAIKITKIPTVIHIQGILSPILNVYSPPGISSFDLININWKEFIKGRGIWHDKKWLEKRSKQEYFFFKNISCFMGRTKWDRNISEFLSTGSKYYHVDEVLREAFYNAPKWRYIKKKSIIITSTLSESLYKGLDFVIKTAHLLHKEGFDFKWKVVGISNNSDIAILLKKKFKVNYTSLNIELLGFKTEEDIVKLLSETTLYVHPSNIENSPNSLCEAQLMGVPSIATNVGGVSSLIEDMKDGFLVPSNDPYLLASKIVKLNRDKLYLTQISNQARQIAQKRHSKDNILNQLIETYQSLIIKS